jgi:nitroimidazol reductase NimA-like FMN-containing flavoprotein (pyridoxamine 5'-phosphate oxidase superfamily)
VSGGTSPMACALLEDVGMRKALVALSPDESLALLRSARVGRLAVVIDRRPHVVPLNCAVDDDGVVVFRTADLTVATSAALAQVAFEVDEIDPERREGWSVVVHGWGREIGDAVDPESKRLLRLPVEPWAPDERNRWYKIVPSEITGRRLLST